MREWADLLDVGRKLGEGLRVGEDGQGWVSQEGGVPDARQAQHDRDVLPERGRPEVLVHIVSPCQHQRTSAAGTSPTEDDEAEAAAPARLQCKPQRAMQQQAQVLQTTAKQAPLQGACTETFCILTILGVSWTTECQNTSISDPTHEPCEAQDPA